MTEDITNNIISLLLDEVNVEPAYQIRLDGQALNLGGVRNYKGIGVAKAALNKTFTYVLQGFRSTDLRYEKVIAALGLSKGNYEETKVASKIAAKQCIDALLASGRLTIVLL